ncbi:MAG: hypothetical protein EBT84_12310, partial [Sphingomonadaceae bacterium]|nr:hypothetical protein [Sphingomonadaceae bacterium]
GLDTPNIVAAAEKVMSRKYIEEVRSLNVSATVKFVLEEFCSLWLRLDDQISAFNKKLAEQAQADSLYQRSQTFYTGSKKFKKIAG